MTYAVVGEGKDQVHIGVLDGVVVRQVDTGAEFEYIAALGDEWDNYVKAINTLDEVLRD
jgi:hypothetical protein